MLLKDALKETLGGWQEDADPAWRHVFRDVTLDFDGMDPELEIEPWEPIFPSRKGKHLPGEPTGAHILRAFDGLPPENIRCVVLGQDPYPCPAFSTGRAFEAGNIANWRELDKMFSKSVRAFIQLVVAARTGCPEYASEFGKWWTLLSDLEAGRLALETPSELADRWVTSGTLLLNSSLTISRFKVEIDRHQSHGHLPLWRPLLLAVLRHLSKQDVPTVYLAFGETAKDTIGRAGLPNNPDQRVIERPHPAFAGELLACGNPFTACNAHLEQMGEGPIDW